MATQILLSLNLKEILDETRVVRVKYVIRLQIMLSPEVGGHSKYCN